MLGADGGAVGAEPIRRGRQFQCLVHQFMNADVLRRHQADHREAERGREDVRLDVDAVLLGHVAHVQADHQRHVQRQQLGGEIEAAFQRRRVHDRDHQIRLLADQVIPGDALLLGVGGQAVGAGQVDQVEGDAIVLEGAGLLFHRLAGPIAHVLAQAGEHVEHGGLADVGLAHQRDGEPTGGAGLRHAAVVMTGAAHHPERRPGDLPGCGLQHRLTLHLHEDLCRLGAAQRHQRAAQ